MHRTARRSVAIAGATSLVALGALALPAQAATDDGASLSVLHGVPVAVCVDGELADSSRPGRPAGAATEHEQDPRDDEGRAETRHGGEVGTRPG